EGGRLFKRLLAPMWLCIGLSIYAAAIHSFSFWILLAFPVYFLEQQIPRGTGRPAEKIWMRLVWSAFFMLGALVISLASQNPVPVKIFLWLYQAGLCMTASLLLGILNPFDAPKEEATIYFLSVFMVPFMI
ncbi:MAG: hypothetical protein ABFD12_14450, partial [Syntrophorhabdus sp.]